MRSVTERERISLDELRRLAAGRFGDMVKAVVDVERRVMIVDADLHADQEALLRPSFGNRSRGVDDAQERARIADLVRGLVVR